MNRSRIKFVYRKITGIDYKNMFRVLNREADNNGKSRLWVKFDFVRCALKYKMGYIDYMKGHYVDLNKEERKKMFTTNNYFSLLLYLNPMSYRVMMDDKILTNKIYYKYIIRDYVDLRVTSLKEFKKFLKGKTNVFSKFIDPTGLAFGGEGVKKIKVKEIENLEELYNDLIKKRAYLVEDEIKQHKVLNEINKFAVNNIRVVTLLKDNKVHFIERVLRINDGLTDTISCHDIQGRLDEEGNLIGRMVDDDLNVFPTHPVTGFKFEGIKIPYMKETLELCEKAAKEIPNVRYIGWDIAITENGPEIIEVNSYPCYTNYQYYLMHDDGVKMNYLEQVKDILGSEVDNVKW